MGDIHACDASWGPLPSRHPAIPPSRHPACIGAADIVGVPISDGVAKQEEDKNANAQIQQVLHHDVCRVVGLCLRDLGNVGPALM